MYGMPPGRAFRGRDRELAHIGGAVGQATRRGSRLVVIVGPTGSGRTSMLRQLAAAGRTDGRRVVELQSWQSVPTMRQVRPSPAGAADHADRSDPPALVCWDDPPWPEPGFVHTLERELRGEPANWVLARRSDQPPLETLLSLPSTCVDLDPLAAPIVAEIAADLLGARPSADLVRLFAVAGGNPGRLTELVGALVEEGIVRVDGRRAVPVSIRLPRATIASIRRTVSGLSPAARHLVQIASIAGLECELVDVARLLGTTVAALMPDLAQATAAGIFRTDTERLVFVHDLVRREIEESVPTAAKRPVQDDVAALRANDARGHGAEHDLDELTPAEQRTARLVRLGLTNRQVARRLHVSPHTVNYHLRHIYRKLAIGTRVELAALVWPDSESAVVPPSPQSRSAAA